MHLNGGWSQRLVKKGIEIDLVKVKSYWSIKKNQRIERFH